MTESGWYLILLLMGPSLFTLILLQIIPEKRDNRYGAAIFVLAYIPLTIFLPFVAGLVIFEIQDSTVEIISWFLLVLLIRAFELGLGLGPLLMSMWKSPK